MRKDGAAGAVGLMTALSSFPVAAAVGPAEIGAAAEVVVDLVAAAEVSAVAAHRVVGELHRNRR